MLRTATENGFSIVPFNTEGARILALPAAGSRFLDGARALCIVILSPGHKLVSIDEPHDHAVQPACRSSNGPSYQPDNQ